MVSSCDNFLLRVIIWVVIRILRRGSIHVTVRDLECAGFDVQG